MQEYQNNASANLQLSQIQDLEGQATMTTETNATALPTTATDVTASPAKDTDVMLSEARRAAEKAKIRQGIMHVRIRHFYCTLEEVFDDSLRGSSFIVGTGTGRPNEPGRVIDASPAAIRQGITPGMPLRRAHRLAPRARFLPASYDRYQPILRQLREQYQTYSRIVESIPIADSYIDLRGCELAFESPVILAERLNNDITRLGLTAQIGIANGKALAELAALMSRREDRKGVLYIPPGREASFVQTLPLSLLLQVRPAGISAPGFRAESAHDLDGASSRSPETEGRSEEIETIMLGEMVAHLKDFGITQFAQVAQLNQDNLRRRLGPLGSWLHQLSLGQDGSLVIPDAPPLSQNARIRFHHMADADEACAAIRKLANYLGDRMHEQRLKGKIVALMLWPSHPPRRQTRKLDPASISEDHFEIPLGEAISGQMTLTRTTDESDVIAHHGLMLFAEHHRPTTRYLQVQLRIGDITTAIPAYYPPPTRSRGRLTRKL
ncbi:MAG TPA: hypothetical protein VFN23_10495 [Ktedonobacteraceae bacterium]|nr:hypothetical protein [Ktedonobacteraceae bacterium]